MFRIQVQVQSYDELHEPYYLDQTFETFEAANSFLVEQWGTDLCGSAGDYSVSDCGGDCCYTYYTVEKAA